MPLNRKMISLTLLFFVSIIRAEEEYFPSSDNLTWDQARHYCQICFKELTTITPTNVHSITDKIAKQNAFDYWIGLRQNLSGSKLWSQWSNGNPVIYQNWYPGHPVLKKKPVPLPTCPTPTMTPRPEMTIEQCPTWQQMLYCLNSSDCSLTDCSTTAVPPTPTTLLTSTIEPTTNPPQFSADSDQPDLEYIEDSCVSMLGFGMWMEKACNESLPYVCYDDRFFGNLSYTEDNFTLMWSAAPGNISEYNVTIYQKKQSEDVLFRNKIVPSNANETSFQLEIGGLVSGVLYTVQVIPVKCGRQLNPQNGSFYSLPDKIRNLTVVAVTTNKIDLSWSKPNGECEFYYIDISSSSNKSEHENCTKQCTTNQNVQHTITNLTPGGSYHIEISAMVNNSKGNTTSIEVYTKPSKVDKLYLKDNTEHTFFAAWNSSDSNANTYLYYFEVTENNTIVNNSTTKQTNVFQYNLKPGTKYTFTVFALVNETVEGDKVNGFIYTRPDRVKDLELHSSNNHIDATWNSTSIIYKNFVVEVFPCDSSKLEFKTTTNGSCISIPVLYAAKCYNVTVSTNISDDVPLSSLTFQTIYTLPVPPGLVTITTISTTSLNVTWGKPDTLDTNAIYIVNYSSDFWIWSRNEANVTGETYYILERLQSGTNYTVEVRVSNGAIKSDASTGHGMTDPEKRYLTFKMMCTSQDKATNLCIDVEKMQSATEKLRKTFSDHFNKDIYWNLSSIHG